MVQFWRGDELLLEIKSKAPKRSTKEARQCVAQIALKELEAIARQELENGRVRSLPHPILVAVWIVHII